MHKKEKYHMISCTVENFRLLISIKVGIKNEKMIPEFGERREAEMGIG